LQEALFPVRREVNHCREQGGFIVFRPEDGADMFLRNDCSYKEPHRTVISQKTAFFIVTVVETPNIAVTMLLMELATLSEP
jgi:hypothetical protein